jgi:hypothetical protein
MEAPEYANAVILKARELQQRKAQGEYDKSAV